MIKKNEHTYMHNHRFLLIEKSNEQFENQLCEHFYQESELIGLDRK